MTERKLPPEDEFTIRCRKLGHLIAFSYCRRENDGLPCARTLDCWYPHFPVVEYLEAELSPEEFARAFGTAVKPKVVSLVELIARAQKNTGK